MAFAENQLKLLDAKLPERHVKTREGRGMTLSYIEGWHAIAEANRSFPSIPCDQRKEQRNFRNRR